MSQLFFLKSANYTFRDPIHWLHQLQLLSNKPSILAKNHLFNSTPPLRFRNSAHCLERYIIYVYYFVELCLSFLNKISKKFNLTMTSASRTCCLLLTLVALSSFLMSATASPPRFSSEEFYRQVRNIGKSTISRHDSLNDKQQQTWFYDTKSKFTTTYTKLAILWYWDKGL